MKALRTLSCAFFASAVSIGVMEGCTLFGGEFAVATEDAARAAANADGGSEDAAASDAAASDAAASDAAATYCSGHRAAAFCEDFDTVADVTQLELEKGGQADGQLTRETFVSPPRALAFGFATMATSGFAVYKRSLQTERPVRLSFDWRVRVFAGTEGQNVQLMTLRRDDAQLSIQRVCEPGVTPVKCTWSLVIGILDGEGGPTFDATPLGTRLSAQDAWSRVTMEIAFSATTGYLALTQDGTTLVRTNRPTARPGGVLTGPTSATVGIGILQGVAGATQIAVDNVLVETL